jgi:hypothetical protein
VGLLVALAVEYVVGLHIDVRRLRDIERQLEAERELREEERRLWSYQLIWIGIRFCAEPDRVSRRPD